MKSTVLAQELFCRGLNSIKPNQLLQNHISRSSNILFVENKKYELNNNVYIVGFGKAVSGMCRTLQDLIGDHIVGGALCIPLGSHNDLTKAGKSDLLPINDGKIRIFEGAKNNLPDLESSKATKVIINTCKSAAKTDLVISLISGGGSALLCSPFFPLMIEDKVKITKILSSKGASISELNVVRQNLSNVKGGKLSEMTQPAQMVNLILSDIIGDSLNLIASGPTIKKTTTPQDAINIINKYQMSNLIPSTALELLNKKSTELGLNSYNDQDCLNLLIGSNKTIIKALNKESFNLGINSIIFSHELQGEAKVLGKNFADLALFLSKFYDNPAPIHDELSENLCFKFVNSHGCSKEEFKKVVEKTITYLNQSIFKNNKNDVCIIGGGETTVSLTPNSGLGGRNQEMVLSAAIQFYNLYQTFENKSIFNKMEFTFLSAGTDGQDGPTNAAGAFFCTEDLNQFDVDLATKHLKEHDSNPYFESNGGLIKTGLTGSNVMDVNLLIISQKINKR